MRPETGADAAAALMAGRLPTNPEMLQFSNISFHHIPNALAPSTLAVVLVFSFCAGIVFLELANNVRYDFLLLKRSTWREPLKLFNRLSYIAARYGAFVFLVITVYYTNMPGLNCDVFAHAINVLWLLPLICVDIIFLQRTLVLYAWQPRLTALLSTMYVIYVAMCAYGIAQFGFGYEIPLSEFCGYQVDTRSQPHAALFIVFYCFMMIFDTTLLLLTMHRLINGGLSALPSLVLRRDSDVQSDAQLLGKSTLSNLLLRQGVVYYVIVEFSRIAFIIVYFCTSDVTSYQVLIAAIIVTVGPVMAGMLFRQTTSAVRRTAYGRDSDGAAALTSSGHRLSAQGTIKGTTTPWGTSSRPDMAEESGDAFTFNTTTASRRRTSLSLEAGKCLTRSDADDDIYGPGGFFNRIKGFTRDRPGTGDSLPTSMKYTPSTLTDEKSMSPKFESKTGDVEIATVVHLCSSDASSSSPATTPYGTPDSVLVTLPAPAAAAPPAPEHVRRPVSRSRRTPLPAAPAPAPQHLSALPQPPRGSFVDVPVNCVDDSDIESHTGA